MIRYNRGTGFSLCSLALLILQPVIFYWHVLISVRAHITYDVESYHLPLMAFIARCVRNGWTPFWNPYTNAGTPFDADIQAQLFYPFTWIVVFLGNLSQGRNLLYWIEWLVAFHMILAGLFTFMLLRRMGLEHPAALLGATVYQLGGFFASQGTHLGAVQAAAWLPLSVLAAFELRRSFRPCWFGILVLSTALSILSGYVAATMVVSGATLLFVLALLIWREASWRILPTVAAAFLAAAAISAVQLVPVWQLTGLSLASIRSTFTPAMGAPLQSLASLIAPDRYHIFEPSTLYKLPYNFTFLYVYCGLAPIVLILIAPFVGSARARMFFALTIAGSFWMLGEYTPVYPFVVSLLPGLIRGALYAWCAIMAFGFFAALTAAFALDRIGPRLPHGAIWLIVLLTSFDLLHAGSDRPMNTANGSWKLSGNEHQYGSDPEALRRLHDLVDTSVPPVRIDYADGWAPSIFGAPMFQLPTAAGNNPFTLLRMHELRRLFSNGPPSDRILPVSNFNSPLLRMLNVGVVASLFQISKNGLEPIAGLNLYRVNRPLPRFFLVPNIRASSGEKQTFELLGGPSFDPAAEAIVEGIPSDRTHLATGDVTVKRYEPDRIDLAVVTSGPAFLATSEPLYPGWQASVNGKTEPMLMTNGVFRGLNLPAGENQITMTYRPQYLTASVMISLLALCGTGFSLWRSDAP